jgi:DeoR family ulaG and ulaABCDEF operon transcriptional repressor
MIEAERHSTIVRTLNREGFLSVKEIVSLTNTSEATARRDLRDLEREGALHRVRGGAESVQELNGRTAAARGNGGFAEPEPATEPQPIRNRSEILELVLELEAANRKRETAEAETNPVPMQTRMGIATEEKRRIGEAAARLCRDVRTISIDTGSTTFHMVEFLPENGLTIITNSFLAAEVINHATRNRLILAGGILYRDSEVILNPLDQSFYSNYSTDILFMGVEGIEESGLLNFEMRVVQTVRQMIEHARKVVVLADSRKFNLYGHTRICGFDKIDTLITDTGIRPEHRGLIERHGIELLVV